MSKLVVGIIGTGKTTTIDGYVKYLLISGKCSPEKSLVLSFTNASAAEMKERFAQKTGTDMDVSTFHMIAFVNRSDRNRTCAILVPKR